MRKVNMTKQKTIIPNAAFMGLTKKQLVVLAAVFVVTIGTVVLLMCFAKMDTDIVMSIAFFELVIGSSFIIKINGTSLLFWVISMFKGPIVRPYQSRGLLDTYEEENK